jgi:epoxyqueuosine reductase
MTRDERTASVKSRAAALGFDACGIAAAGNVDPEDRLGAWLARGFHADMGWITATKAVRQDIRLKLPGARSVVVVARDYYAERPDAPSRAGTVSRYAWGRDYHRVLRKPLESLARAIAGMAADVTCYCCIDSGPVIERAWAARAGVGWIGKHGVVIREDLGSWFFLGVIATTLDLTPDAPAVDRCGACARCIEACPTGAIVEPRVLDARRCIAYHTIENRGAVPETLRPAFGHWVFGCDLCQEACPWNRYPKITSERDFHPRPGHANPDLAEWAAMDEAAFHRRFAGTPVHRATHEGMQRNIQIARKNAQP